MVLAMCCAGLLALNWGVLALFGEKSSYRAEHGFVGLVFLAAYVGLWPRVEALKMKAVTFFSLAVIPCYLGTVAPDLDISLLGIGGHRNPIFHGCFFYVGFWFFVGRHHRLAHVLVTGFGIGLASHLLWDVVDYGDVRWISGGFADRVWLSVNGAICLYRLPVRRKESDADARVTDQSTAPGGSDS